MHPITLKFPDVSNIVNFVVKQRLTEIDSNSEALTITGVLTEKQIRTACEHYGAILQQGASQLKTV